MPWRDDLESQHRDRQIESMWRQRSTVESPQGAQVSVDGQTYLNFCSNDYLGLANHPKLAAAAIGAIEKRGTGSGASHLVCGHFDEHHQLEQEIAQLVGAEKAIVFSTGYMANLAIPQTFLGRNDLILMDRWNHASLIDAGRYCEAQMRRYPHFDLAAIEKLLVQSDAKRKLVSTDGVFSMDGDIADVRALQELCKNHESLLVVDDAHGFGVLGSTGAGTLESANIKVGGNVLMVGTLGKSAGSFGAFVAGDQVYIETLVQFARTYIYTTALPPSIVAATRTAIQIIQNEPERRDRLFENVKLFRDLVSKSHLNVVDSVDSMTAIEPIIVGTSSAAIEASEYLKANGLWVTAIRPPTVPEGSARLRVTISASHQPSDIEQLAKALTSDRMSQILDHDSENVAG